MKMINRMGEHYDQLIGLTVDRVVFMDNGDDGLWPVLVMSNKKGETFHVDVSMDPEGNGPGFLDIYKVGDDDEWSD